MLSLASAPASAWLFCGPHNGKMRISAKVDYAVRAMAQLAADQSGEPVKAEHIAREQGIPPKFLLAILHELKGAGLVRSQRGLSGGFVLDGSPEQITVADVIRAIDGPLANVRDTSMDELLYVGPAQGLLDVWMAVRTSLRSVLEGVTLADLASGQLPRSVRALAAGEGVPDVELTGLSPPAV